MAVITGASRGIGAAVARQLARAGRQARARLAQRRRPRPRRRRRDAVRRARPGAARGALPRRPSSGSAARHPRRERGRRRVRPVPRPLARVPRRDDRRQPEGDALRGPRRAAAPARAARADIVTLASEAGRRGLPYEAVYCASKFGQVGFTRALDHELREQGIRCTNVCPGGVATDFALERGAGRTHGRAAGDDDRRRRRRGRRVRARRAPRGHPHPRDRAAADDGGELGMRRRQRGGSSRRRDINRLVIPGAHASTEGRPRRRRRAATRRRPRRTRREWGSSAPTARYEELLADPEIEAVYISLPNTLHVRVVDQGARGRQARSLREAASPQPDDVEARVRRGRARPTGS